jgi:hypothetical protein
MPDGWLTGTISLTAIPVGGPQENFDLPGLLIYFSVSGDRQENILDRL